MTRDCIIEAPQPDTNHLPQFRQYPRGTRRKIVVLAGLIGMSLCLGTAGCRDQKSDEEAEFDFGVYAGLPGLEGTSHDKLRDELARLKGSGVTPELLADRQKPGKGRVDLSERLAKVIPDPNEALKILNHLERYRFVDGQPFDRVKLVEAVAVSSSYEDERLALWRAVDDERAVLWVDHRVGNAIDLSFVDRLMVGFRLESIQLVRGIEKQNLELAVRSFDRMLAYAGRLGQVWHLVPRLAAAEVRSEALIGLQWILEMESVDQEARQRLRGRLLAELSNWPDESNVWIGDRALGLHTYELIRDGHFLSLLTEDEIEELNQLGNRYKTAQLVSVEVDGDQWFYLEYMRRLIELADQPFYQRAEELAKLRIRSLGMDSAGKYPFVAEEMLLQEISEAQRSIAMDRARVELWALALSHATGQATSDLQVNPHTGEPYAVEQRGDSIVAFGLDESRGEGQAIVPMH